MIKKLKFSQMLSISLMLFAIFFGAGNMIFPPALGQAGGTHFLWALLGFVVTDAGIAILGIAAVVFAGDSMCDWAKIVSKKFALCLAMVVYLLIGPLFALPRTGSVAFELAITPFLESGTNPLPYSVIFIFLFFALTYLLSSNPSKIVDIVGKVLTPVLLGAITLIFIGSLLQSGSTLQGEVFGVMQVPLGNYQDMPFFQGMMEGYLALDGPAGLAFAILVIQAIRQQGINDKKAIITYTCLCGLGAACFLSLVYFALAYVGAITPGIYANGGILLSEVTRHLFGNIGVAILGLAVLLACLTTSIGLTTSFSDYIVTTYPNCRYKQVAFAVCAFSFVIANVGLSQLIQISLPILVMLYPITVVLMVLSFAQKRIADQRMVYILAMLCAFGISFFNGLDQAGIHLGRLHDLVAQVPFYNYGVVWILPAMLGAFIGALPWCKKHVPS